jgi:hypothetical protein
MKKMNVNLIICSVLFIFFNKNVFSTQLSFNCEPEDYCRYQGMFRNIAFAETEFEMLKERPIGRNFQNMYSVLLYVVACSEQSKECMEALEDPNCPISVYTQRLVNYYKENVAELNDTYVVELFSALKAGKAGELFNHDEQAELEQYLVPVKHKTEKDL